MNCKPALQVGISTYISKTGCKLPYNYRHVTETEDKWVNPQEWLPIPYDLVILKIGSVEKVGWYTGNHWDGYKIKPEDIVSMWKRKIDDEK